MANYSIGKTLPVVDNGATLNGHNFAQLVPHTSIFTGITGLSFVDCNLVNCDVPADAIVQRCNVTQISLCSHVDPLADIAPCIDNCTHVTAVDELEIDGVIVDTIYSYANKVVV